MSDHLSISDVMFSDVLYKDLATGFVGHVVGVRLSGPRNRVLLDAKPVWADIGQLKKMNEEENMITLGKTYKDKLTGFQGVAAGRAEYISGCDQVLLLPPAKDGAYVDGQWFDVQRCEEVDKDPVVLDNRRTPGHDKQAPKI